MQLNRWQIAAWLLLAAIAAVTLAPIGWRPETGISAQLERFAAFAALGLAFGLAYPRRLWLVALLLVAAALALEALQLVVATRHAGLRDVLAKLAGGGCGLLLGWATTRARRRPAATDRST